MYMISTSWQVLLDVHVEQYALFTGCYSTSNTLVTDLVTVGSRVELALFTGDTQGVHDESLVGST